MLWLVISALEAVSSLPFLFAAIPGMPGWCNLELLHVHRLSDTFFPLICALWKQNNYGENSCKPPLCGCYFCNCILFQERCCNLSLPSQSSLKRFLDGIYFRNIMCRQEWMATEIYRKIISWRGWGNIINHWNRAQWLVISREPSNGISFVKLTATHLMAFFFPLHIFGLFFQISLWGASVSRMFMWWGMVVIHTGNKIIC